MKSTDTSHEELVRAATEMLNQCISQVQDELLGVALDVLATSPEASAIVPPETVRGSRLTFLETIDTLHKVIPFLPKSHAQELKPTVFGIEDLWALTNGFLHTLASSKTPDQVASFDVTDRCTGRTILVTLPAGSHIVLADDIKKTLRKLKKLHKTIHGG